VFNQPVLNKRLLSLLRRKPLDLLLKVKLLLPQVLSVLPLLILVIFYDKELLLKD
jgi:hypothetical protein